MGGEFNKYLLHLSHYCVEDAGFVLTNMNID